MVVHVPAGLDADSGRRSIRVALPKGSAHPPKPRFALTVGVVGHRPDDLAKDPLKEDRVALDLPPREIRLAKVVSDVRVALAAIAAAAAKARQDHHEHFADAEPDAPF